MMGRFFGNPDIFDLSLTLRRILKVEIMITAREEKNHRNLMREEILVKLFENLNKQNHRDARYIGSSLKSFLIYWICFCIATLLLIQFCFHDYIFIYI